jgi:hypothetical protein
VEKSKIYILVAIAVLFLCFTGAIMIKAADFPDSKSLQPMPSDTQPDFPNNIRRDENNVSTNTYVEPPQTDSTSPSDSTNPASTNNATNPANSANTTNPTTPSDSTNPASTNNATNPANSANTTNPTNIDYIIDELSDGNTSYTDTYNHILYVSEPGNNRILVFKLNSDNTLIDNEPDNVLGQLNFTAKNPGSMGFELNNPVGLAYDSASHQLFVDDTGNNRIMVFDVSSISNGESAINVLSQKSAGAKSLSEKSNSGRSKINYFLIIPFSLIFLIILFFLLFKIISPGKK